MARTGKWLGVPFDWRRPTVARLKSRWWNADDPRLITPRAFGWGWALNLYWIAHPGRRRQGRGTGTT